MSLPLYPLIVLSMPFYPLNYYYFLLFATLYFRMYLEQNKYGMLCNNQDPDKDLNLILTVVVPGSIVSTHDLE